MDWKIFWSGSTFNVEHSTTCFFPGVLAAIDSSVIACKVLCLWAVVNVDVVKILVKVGKEGPVSTFLSFWSLLSVELTYSVHA